MADYAEGRFKCTVDSVIVKGNMLIINGYRYTKESARTQYMRYTFTAFDEIARLLCPQLHRGCKLITDVVINSNSNGQIYFNIVSLDKVTIISKEALDVQKNARLSQPDFQGY